VSNTLPVHASKSYNECACCSISNSTPNNLANLRPFTLIPKGPISAICWYGNTTDASNPKDLRIRVFTITSTKPKEASQLIYNQSQGWNGNPGKVADVLTNSPNAASAIGACQMSGDSKGAISVFYQPESKVLDLKPVATRGGEAGTTDVRAVVLPKGVPTSI
jgi:hypothetical protein